MRVALMGLLTMRVTESLAAVSTLSQTRWLVVDFDGTCTERDTTPLLPKLAAMLCDDSDSVERRISRFKELENEFVCLYAAAKNAMSSQTMTLCDALDTLDAVSKAVTEKVSQSGVLLGLDRYRSEDISRVIERDSEFGDRVRLRSGCASVLAQAMSSWQLGVLSINWCPPLIDATLLQPISRECMSSSTQSVPIWCNSVDHNGVVSQQISGALDKRAQIAKLKPSGLVVYVGDSTLDLAALVEADVGILIGNSKSTTTIAEEWGIKVIPLNQWHFMEKGETPRVIWMAESWSEIENLLLYLTR